jgi:hypothetical protein
MRKFFLLTIVLSPMMLLAQAVDVSVLSVDASVGADGRSLALPVITTVKPVPAASGWGPARPASPALRGQTNLNLNADPRVNVIDPSVQADVLTPKLIPVAIPATSQSASSWGPQPYSANKLSDDRSKSAGNQIAGKPSPAFQFSSFKVKHGAVYVPGYPYTMNQELTQYSPLQDPEDNAQESRFAFRTDQLLAYPGSQLQGPAFELSLSRQQALRSFSPFDAEISGARGQSIHPVTCRPQTQGPNAPEAKLAQNCTHSPASRYSLQAKPRGSKQSRSARLPTSSTDAQTGARRPVIQ